MPLAVELRDVTKRYADLTAVNRLSVTVPTGCVHGILGRNGAGKTTTIRMLMGILRPDQGTVRVLGEEPTRARRRLGYLPEEKGLYRKMRLLDLVSYFGRLKGMPRQTAFAEADRLLDMFGLASYRLEKCEALSKGMGQKVQIAATLVHDPELVVLDEPFSGLDPVNVELVRDTVLRLKQRGRTVILSTHTMEQAEQICDSLLLIDAGRVLLDGPLATIRASADRSIRIDYDGDGAVLRSLPGVIRVNDAGKHAELTLAPETDPQAILLRLTESLVIRRFDTREASLHEIFVRTVGNVP
jgi:ABC-2 type transport system ATP-binding protein